jgi:hypothetical protein
VSIKQNVVTLCRIYDDERVESVLKERKVTKVTFGANMGVLLDAERRQNSLSPGTSNLAAPLEDESEDLHGPVNKIQFTLVSNIAVAA